ncbi:MAG: DUF2007 domain-containing protein [Fulvivirga sp.]|uniref:putative signal transducing protein n=1 Tax=Fulvivirga sp. TaxID=1931237 RepID=UPI0032F02CA2
MDNLIKILTGDDIGINRISSMLNESGIPTLIKNVEESARTAGFGALSNSTELFVNESDVELAQEIKKDIDRD